MTEWSPRHEVLQSTAQILSELATKIQKYTNG